MNFQNIKEAVEFYIKNGFRVMPIFGIHEKCQHRPIKPELDCKGQCWGKVPMQEHWPDKEIFTPDDFNEGCNLAIIMGKQLDGRWFLGIDIDGIFDISEFLILPPTLECITNRGKHLIYEVPEDSPLGNWNDIFRTRSESLGYRTGYQGAVDIKYCRGAMVSPPSLNKSGNEYQWIEWRQPELLPDSEIKYLIRKRRYAYPDVKRYSKWSLDPLHKNKKP